MDEPPRTSSLKAPNLELIGHKVISVSVHRLCAGCRVFGAVLSGRTALGDGGHGFKYILVGCVRRVRELRAVAGPQERGAGNMLELRRNAGVFRQRG